MSDPTPAPAVEDEPGPPGRLRLTAYAAEQVLWLVPLLARRSCCFVVGGVLVVVWVGIPLLLAGVPDCSGCSPSGSAGSPRGCSAIDRAARRTGRSRGGGPLVQLRGIARPTR